MWLWHTCGATFPASKPKDFAEVSPRKLWHTPWRVGPAPNCRTTRHANPRAVLKVRRNVPLTQRTRAMLEARKSEARTFWVFAEDSLRPTFASSLDHVHRKLREALRLPGDSVVHSVRDTYGTRLGNAGADACTIMRSWAIRV